MTSGYWDAVVIGAGPNGLAAAITIAREGRSVLLLEAAATVGGGVRSAELTLPGFVHDVCSTVFPFGRGSPFFAQLELERHGLRFVDPPIALGHPLDDGSVALLHRDVGATAQGLGRDARAYEQLFGPLVKRFDRLAPHLLAPFHIPLRPDRALDMASFGLHALQSTTSLGRRFRGDQARALFAGVSAHGMLKLSQPFSAAAGLLLSAAAHAHGWPIADGGSQNLADALATRLTALGGEIRTGQRVATLGDLPRHDVALFDVSPKQLLAITGDTFAGRYRTELTNYRYGPGVFKLDIALDGEIPWRNPELRDAGTVHLGGTLEQIAQSEAAVHAGHVSDRPFVLLSQQSNFDASRAPAGKTTVWAYCHVPNGWTGDATERVLGQIERAAPGFRDRILAMKAAGPASLEAYNANDIGGDINGGLQNIRQLFTRPAIRLDPYSTPDPSVFICSASTPPGGGVHGMSGYHAANSALRRTRRVANRG